MNMRISSRPRRRLAAVLTAAVLAAAAATAAVVIPGCGARKAPVVVIGLDGATWDLLVPWMEQGELPNLKKFADEAAVGKLWTVYPILSPVCWTSAVTGVNPGKHGIFDFQKEDPDGGAPLVETATHRRAQPIWMLLSDKHYRVGVMNVPMTYPPDPVRGDMISGFPFPNEKVNFTYPPELQSKLDDYPLDYLGLNLFTRNADQMYSDFLKGQEARRKVAVDWIKSGRYDFMWLVFTGPDKVQHFFWKYMDKNHPEYDPEKAKVYGDAILNLWKKQDAILGEMLAALPKNTTVLMMSDHGFDAIYRQVNLMNFLAKTGIPDWLSHHATPPMLVTNGLLHYQTEGKVPGTSDREAFIDTLTSVFRAMRDPKTGECPFESIFRREDIYHGRMLEKAPDVVFWETDKYYVTRGVPDSLNAPAFQNIWTTSFSANHRPDGIVLVKGPDVHKNTQGSLRERLAAGGDFKHANIIDVTPTLLALMNQIVPDQMDGRVLDEVLNPAFLKAHPPQVKPVDGFLLDRLPPEHLTDQEKEAMRALPYLQ